ncbi:MAG: hypothetical protein BSOLF_1910 [Candidatus Carbobacillus altaicus]|uniref:Uncharacterized protein n=1 Tax=Candidatus Carbonibacillus altaicus TaxID=2163959 RepID=A0A2R6XYP6_9BACL|nr:MAG: hypothetical protein BSOLF_1910 [Candidatus Carbobacillus altaicus]
MLFVVLLNLPPGNHLREFYPAIVFIQFSTERQKEVIR